MNDFKRGLSEKNVDALRRAAEAETWWRDVLADKSLMIAVRHEYLNVYWQGQSIFLIEFPGGKVSTSTHAKYLLNPELSEQVPLVNGTFDLTKLLPKALTEKYEDHTLKNLKKAAAYYANDEKKGVHALATANSSIIDVEIAFPNGGHAKGEKLPRADVAAVEKKGDGARLVFWEAKLYTNKELWAHGDKIPVVEQIGRYKTAVATHRAALLDSYRRVASNLKAIEEMSNGTRKCGEEIELVAANPEALTVGDPVDVGLIVFDYDAAQREVWQKQSGKLIEAGIDKTRLKARGDANGIKL
jgi:hypothetical protein